MEPDTANADAAVAVDATDATFEADVLRRSHEHPVVVDFWAEWCGPCKQLGPVLEEAVRARADAVALVKVDVDGNRDLAHRYRIGGIPAVKAFRNGEVVREFVGALGRAGVEAFLDELLAPPAAERVLEELRARGEAPEAAAALERGDVEAALEALVAEVPEADREGRERLRLWMVSLFGDLGVEHPVTVRYRRRLAAALY